MPRTILCLLFILFCTSAATSETLYYRETTGDAVINHIYQFSFTGGLHHLKTRHSYGTMEYVMDTRLETLSWTAFDEDNGTDLQAVRDGKYIHVEGWYSGKRINKKFKVGNDSWIQSAWFVLQEFVRSDKKKIIFQTFRITDMSLNKMEAKRKQSENIQVGGKKVECVMVQLNATGFLPALWNAKFWFRKSDGRFMYYESIHGIPGFTPLTVIEYLGPGSEPGE